MVEYEKLVLLIFTFGLYVILFKAEVFAIDWNKMNAVLDLHFHVEDLVLYYLLLIITIFVGNLEGEALFFIFKSIVFIDSCLLINQLNLISSNIGLILISGLVFVFYPDEDN